METKHLSRITLTRAVRITGVLAMMLALASFSLEPGRVRAQSPRIVASAAGDWFWMTDFIPGLLNISIFASQDPDADLLWEGSRETDEWGFVLVGYPEHNVDLLPGHYLVISDGGTEKGLVLETITMEVFDTENEIMAGTAIAGTLVWAFAGEESSQTGIDVTTDQNGAWLADFKTIGFDITEAMRPWSYAHIYDEDGDATEAGTPAPQPPTGYHDYDQGDVPSWACNAGGWTIDPDNPYQDIDVRILVDGVQVLDNIKAENYREDLEISWNEGGGGCPGGTCAFEVSLWDYVTHYEAHEITVEAQDLQSGEWYSLNATPKPLTCRTYDIYVFDTKTSETRQVTNLADSDEFNPKWSPNNKQIVFDVVNSDGSLGTYVVDVQSGESAPLVGAEDGGNDPAWSPNGRWIAFDRFGYDDPSLYLVPASGGERTLLREDAIMASWAPNSKRIAFVQPSDGSIWTMDLSGKATFIAADAMVPAWSPDGKWIAYQHAGDIWKVRVNLQGAPLGDPIQVTTGAAEDGRPTWSNNSQTIAFHSGLGRDFDIWTVPDSGGMPTWLTGAPEFGDYDPAYSNNGRYIAYASFSPARQAARETIIVSSSADSGTGSLRQALLDAQSSDTITFDPAVFPPDAPVIITVASGLPQISQGYLTIDASNAGVVLDGSQLPGDTWIPGLEIVSDGNIIRGLQVVNFTGTGIVVAYHGRNNTIGGDRNIGVGPIGQGNLASGNDYGIGLWDYASNNIVTGNLVGTDVSGTGDLGNRSSGIWITGGGMKNVIGPDNISAYNDRCGIEVEGSDSLGNTLTQNSIHDNGGVGICLWGGGNTGLSAPFIVGFDLAGDLISGSTCANCTVEIFSDSGDEGAAYEGQVGADSLGVFTFNNKGNKGAAFTNTHITLTATDADGNTSQFSRPIGGDIRVVMLQEGNVLPKFRLLTRPSSELADNRIGLSYAGSGLWRGPLDRVLDEITDLGAKRVDTSLYEIEPPIDWSGSEYDIRPEFDQLIDDLAENGVAVNYMLHFWDKVGHANGEELSTPRFKTPEQVQDFLDYVRFLVSHFRGRVQYYTIWSEPDNCIPPPIKCVEPDDYINLARQTIPVIRQEDPQAKVVLAPNVLFFAREYLFTVLRSDVVQLFDVISWHPMYDVAPNIEFYGNYYYEYPSIIQEIKQTAFAHGFDGEYWGTELTWNSKEICNFPGCRPADQPWDIQETDLQAAKYYARGIVMHLGLDVGTSVGGFQSAAPWSYPTMRNLNTVMAGTRPTNITVKIEGEASNIMSYGFILPNGDKLFALWTNGAAVEDDPGVNTTFTFPGLSAQKVVGIDVLNGFEQELITEMENGNLVIRNLLIKDYPIILRLTD